MFTHGLVDLPEYASVPVGMHDELHDGNLLTVTELTTLRAIVCPGCEWPHGPGVVSIPGAKCGEFLHTEFTAPVRQGTPSAGLRVGRQVAGSPPLRSAAATSAEVRPGLGRTIGWRVDNDFVST